MSPLYLKVCPGYPSHKVWVFFWPIFHQLWMDMSKLHIRRGYKEFTEANVDDLRDIRDRAQTFKLFPDMWEPYRRKHGATPYIPLINNLNDIIRECELGKTETCLLTKS